jgi:hypothetical protein
VSSCSWDFVVDSADLSSQSVSLNFLCSSLDLFSSSCAGQVIFLAVVRVQVRWFSLRPDFVLCRFHSQHQVGSPVDFSYAVFLLTPLDSIPSCDFCFRFSATGLHFQAATTADFSWSGRCSVLSSRSRITVSGACSDQPKVNAIAAAAFRSLRALLDFLWIWFSLPRFQVVLSSLRKRS